MRTPWAFAFDSLAPALAPAIKTVVFFVTDEAYVAPWISSCCFSRSAWRNRTHLPVPLAHGALSSWFDRPNGLEVRPVSVRAESKNSC